MNSARTGYKSNSVFIRKKSGKFQVWSDDKAFRDYYLSGNLHPTRDDANNELQSIIKAHRLERFT